jgi:hypothetical protein
MLDRNLEKCYLKNRNKLLHKGDDMFTEEQHLENIIKHRCIQVIDIPVVEHIDYHKLLDKNDQEASNGAYLVDYIVKNAYPPIGTWK